MCGKLVTSEADVAATILAQCCNREKIIDYVLPIQRRKFWIYFHQPEIAIDIFFIQFNKKMWLAILVMVLSLQGLMTLMTFWDSKNDNKKTLASEYKHIDMLSWSLCKYMWNVTFPEKYIIV